MKYDKENIFAKILRGEIPSDAVYEDDKVLAFEDINPVAPVHILIIPKVEIAKVQDLDHKHDEHLSAMFAASRKIAILKNLADDGYRLVINCGERACQSVFHLHMHMIGGRDLQWPPG